MDPAWLLQLEPKSVPTQRRILPPSSLDFDSVSFFYVLLHLQFPFASLRVLPNLLKTHFHIFVLFWVLALGNAHPNSKYLVLSKAVTGTYLPGPSVATPTAGTRTDRTQQTAPPLNRRLLCLRFLQPCCA